jgi:hypothetical protein
MRRASSAPARSRSRLVGTGGHHREVEAGGELGAADDRHGLGLVGLGSGDSDCSSSSAAWVNTLALPSSKWITATLPSRA